MTNIDVDDLAGVNGGLSWAGVKDAAKGGFGLRTLYRGAVKEVTADLGGWKLANQMYGSSEHGASWQEKLRARSAMKSFLDGGDRLPSWAPNW